MKEIFITFLLFFYALGAIVGACQNVDCLNFRDNDKPGCKYDRAVKFLNVGYLAACELWRPRWSKP